MCPTDNTVFQCLSNFTFDLPFFENGRSNVVFEGSSVFVFISYFTPQPQQVII